MIKPLFNLGMVVATPGIIDLMNKEDGLDVTQYVYRHQTGDWSDMSEEDQASNQNAVNQYARVFSAYQTEHGRIWIITEADRSLTTALLPEEY